MDRTRRYTASFSNPASAGAYAAGDEISNSTTAGSVVFPTFDLGSSVRKARIVRAALDVTPASSNLVITAFDVAMLIFKAGDAPAAAGDNVALNIPASSRAKAAKFVFANTAWTNPAGGVTAGTSGFQEVLSAVAIAGSGAVGGNLFDFTGDKLATPTNSTARTLTAVLQVQAAWTPGAVINAFGITLDIEVEE